MEGIYTLLLVALGAAFALGFVIGLLVPRHRALAAFLSALVALALMVAEHIRLNGQPNDAAPFILYALLAALAFVPAFIGAAIAAALRNRGS